MIARLSILAGSVSIALVACSTNEPPKQTSAPAAAASSKPAGGATEKVASAQSFGAPLSAATPYVPLVEILRTPNAWDGKRVRTRGEVVAVCQAAGCWADLRPPTDGKIDAPSTPTHVTMHDHAFFLPKTAKTKLAEVEGTISIRALSQAECDHYNSEGASLTAGAPVVGVDAIGVALDGS